MMKIFPLPVVGIVSLYLTIPTTVGQNIGYVFQDWLKVAAGLSPQYDYFNFADVVMKDKATTGSLYISLMNDTLQNAPRKKKSGIINAIVLFNKKKQQGFAFLLSVRRILESEKPGRNKPNCKKNRKT
ncbi:uncharacterized protein EV154DRAFT_476303 [Mucor mucedo]|uniref:uncharacterized protein n=1 Tax=Mucor mucedo TaxID=29922 RepID=UPI00221F7E92|nr:uncharacterized protein EV154DRAFT_476303 [Mucor mucedo]KAI7896657.1 hypothetical protein EV154DRAFT_476303 [Mucor mucedo]